METRSYVPTGQALKLPIIFGVFMLLSTVTVALRIHVRRFMVKSFGADDWTAVLGWILFNTEGVLAIVGAFHGIGEHLDLIPSKDVPIALLWFWVCGLLYFLSNMIIKLSIALTLLRILIEPSHRMIITGGTIVLLVTSVVGIFVFALQCVPVSYFWTRAQSDANGHCIKPDILTITVYIYSAINCIWDWTMAILPWFMVKDLQLARKTKYMVAVILGLGSIASIAILVRFAFIHELTDRGDLLYKSTKVAIWVVIEGGLSLVASSMATLKPLFKVHHSKKSGKSDRSSSTQSGSETTINLALQDKKPTFAPKCSTYTCTVTANGHVCTIT